MGFRTSVQGYLLTAGALLIVIVLAVLFGMAVRQEQLITSQVNASADALSDQIALTRRWNSDYGGVFVEKRAGVKSSPQLAWTDVHSVDGKTYHLRNHAMMTRELSQYAESVQGFSFHITSLKLLNPDNKSDAWEADALRSLDEAGGAEVGQVTQLNGRHVYRVMRPLRYESSCVNCHAAQGWRIDQICGGISVTLPYEETLLEVMRSRRTTIVLGCVLTLVLGLVLYFLVWRLMNRLASQNARLEELNGEKNRFLGMAAHDLRNPLASLKGFADILLQGYFGEINEGQRNVLQKMGRASQHMLALINDLLDVSVIEAGRLDLHRENVDLGAFLQDAYEFNVVLASAKDIELELAVAPDLPPVALDKNRIGQVINNLIANALKFSHPGTRVTLGARAEGSEVQIFVADQGQGIPATELSRLFADFSQTSVRPTGDESSTGLGLAIVKRMVEAHGGRVWVESEPGRGCTFTFTVKT